MAPRMISRERWPEADALLKRVLRLPSKECDLLLKTECHQDPEMYAYVKALLSTEQNPDLLADSIFLSSENHQRLLEQLDQVCNLNTDAIKGQKLGAYIIEYELGRGGTAVVYAASRTDGEFKQNVAIKLLLQPHNSQQIIQRFNQERQILASLNHPGISRFLDHGISMDGRPFYVMERINGHTINQYCLQKKLSLYAILHLWLSVADAVAFAHQHLLVHRDLKPSNILVSENGEVKLLDFGIAKIIQSQDSDVLDLTQTGSRPMTLRYASPEQISEQPITTATDIYQLGVLLYELLTGQTPYLLKGGSRIEWEEAIRHQQPYKPSQALQHLLSSKEANGKTILIPNVKLGELSGDLDAIILKALSKETKMRYGSAESMSEDIKRFMTGLPIKARPATWVYKSRRFFWRHRALMTGLMAGAILLASLLVFHTHQLTKERDRALFEANKAEQVTTFLTAIFQGGNPELAGQSDLTARELLDRGASRVDEELANQPKIMSEVQSVIGKAYLALGQYQKSGKIFNSALNLNQEIYGKNSAEVAENLNLLSVLKWEIGEYDDAEKLQKMALKIRQELPDYNQLDIANSLNNLALVYGSQGLLDEAQHYYEESIRIKEQVLGFEHVALANTLSNLGSIHRKKGEYNRAIKFFHRAISIHEPGSSSLARVLTNLADALGRNNQYLDAKKEISKALEIKQSIYGNKHPQVANTLNIKAILLNKMGDVEGARDFFQQALNIYHQSYGADHPKLATVQNNIAAIDYGVGNYDLARTSYSEVLRIRLAKFDPEHPKVLQTRVWLAKSMFYQGDYEAVEAQLKPTVKLLREQNKDKFNLSVALLALGEVYTRTGRANLAEPMLRESRKIVKQSKGSWYPHIAAIELALANCLIKLEKIVEAKDLLKTITSNTDPAIVSLIEKAQVLLNDIK